MVINKNLLPSQNKRIDKGIESLLVITQQYHEKITFNIVKIVNRNVVQKISLLIKYNSIIN